jgi:hypothetical protein
MCPHTRQLTVDTVKWPGQVLDKAVCFLVERLQCLTTATFLQAAPALLSSALSVRMLLHGRPGLHLAVPALLSFC